MSEPTIPPTDAPRVAGHLTRKRSAQAPSTTKTSRPCRRARRTWGTYNYAALWIAMSVNIPTYLLASAMIAGGMSWKQAIFTVFLGNVLVLDPDAAQRARRSGVRNSLSRFRALGVRSAGRERARHAARAGGLRLVRDSNMDRRRSDLRDDRGAGARRWKNASWGVPAASWCFLAAESGRDRARNQDDPLSAGHHRAVSAVDRRGAVALGARESGRIRADAGHAFEISDLRRVFQLLRAVADGRGGVLGHCGAEHSRLHALREAASASRWSGRRSVCRRR